MTVYLLDIEEIWIPFFLHLLLLSFCINNTHNKYISFQFTTIHFHTTSFSLLVFAIRKFFFITQVRSSPCKHSNLHWKLKSQTTTYIYVAFVVCSLKSLKDKKRRQFLQKSFRVKDTGSERKKTKLCCFI